jgi:hypothetical protein
MTTWTYLPFIAHLRTAVLAKYQGGGAHAEQSKDSKRDYVGSAACETPHNSKQALSCTLTGVMRDVAKGLKAARPLDAAVIVCMVSV